MKHARPDYDGRIVDLDELIPADEPVLLIRGQDLAAEPTARAWCAAARELGADDAVIAAVEAHIPRIEEWQRDVAAKVPDMPAWSGRVPEPDLDLAEHVNALLHDAFGVAPCESACTHVVKGRWTALGAANVFGRAAARIERSESGTT